MRTGWIRDVWGALRGGLGASPPDGQRYPVTVGKPVMSKTPPPGGGVEGFDTDEALAINHARMTHLDSLALPVEGKRVLDVGSGVGHLAQYFVRKGCEVLCIDGRDANVASLRQRYPGLRAMVANVESHPLAQLGGFDIVFCYGLLYHVENPIAALRNMESICGSLLLLETVVADCVLPLLRMDEETASFNQALGGLGCRPTPSYVVLVLNRIGFPWIYMPVNPPNHPDFLFKWKNDMSFSRDDHLLRCIFVASRNELHNDALIRLL